MLSIRARLINGALRMGRRFGIEKKMEASLADQSALRPALQRVRRYDQIAPPRALRRKWSHHVETVGASPLHILQGDNAAGRRVVLYLHGGGYMVGPARMHWTSIAPLAAEGGADMAMLIYPKTPEHDHRATIATALEAYELLAARYGAENLVVAGDSAGGGLTVTLLSVLREKEQEQPHAAILVSPWLDVSMSDPAAAEQSVTDLMLTIRGAKLAGEYYAADREGTDPLVSPRFASTTGLAPMHIFVGTEEIFLADCRAFAAKAKANGDHLTIRELDRGQHVSALYGTREGKLARAQMLALIDWP